MPAQVLGPASVEEADWRYVEEVQTGVRDHWPEEEDAQYVKTKRKMTRDEVRPLRAWLSAQLGAFRRLVGELVAKKSQHTTVLTGNAVEDKGRSDLVDRCQIERVS